MDEPVEPATPHGETVRGYIGALSRWVLLDGSRRMVAGVLLLSATIAFALCLELFGPIADAEPAFSAMSGLIAGNLALISIVIAIDQLVLSRELVTPGERLGTIEDVAEFRERVAETTGETALPITAPRFLDVVLTSTLEVARGIDLDATRLDERDRQRLAALVEEVIETVETVDTVVKDDDVRPFEALVRALYVDYGSHIRTVDRLRNGGSLPASIDHRLSVLHDHLVLIDVSRQYFRTLYIQRELPRLSRMLLYVGGPAEVALVGILFVFMTAPPYPEAFALLAGMAGFAPLAVLLSYIIRIAIIAELTASVVPFVRPHR
ncbi:hypothetical protein [Halalkalicoccus subterraneus]|uniref:hypothetical protein n=1 Tax=Halalkalicoccus subterraneus TaxID=2675002 RepID=UPI000EFC606C|nr:hypothetical protein [Halalkalicoccus subterraneus]